jgi:hypothetical protein
VEKWTWDGTTVDCLLYGGNSLGRARSVFERAIKHRPRIRLTLRQRTAAGSVAAAARNVMTESRRFPSPWEIHEATESFAHGALFRVGAGPVLGLLAGVATL